MQEEIRSYGASPSRIAYLQSLSDEEIEEACASVTWKISEQAQTLIDVHTLCDGLHPSEGIFEYVRGYRDFSASSKPSQDDQLNIYYMAGYWDAQKTDNVLRVNFTSDK